MKMANLIEQLKEVGYYASYFIPGVGVIRAYKASRQVSELTEGIMLDQIPYDIGSKGRLDSLTTLRKYGGEVALSTEALRGYGLLTWYVLRSMPEPFNYIGDAIGILTNILTPISQIWLSRRSRVYVSKIENNKAD